LGANPYLCTSTDIEVTPVTEKSKGGIGYLLKEDKTLTLDLDKQ